MTILRALVGAYSLVAFMGFVVSVPLGWTIVLGIAATPPTRSSRVNRISRMMSYCRRSFFHGPHLSRSTTRLW